MRSSPWSCCSRILRRLTQLQPQGPAMRALQALVEQRRALVGDVGRLTNRITWALKQYFPQVLEWFEDKNTLVFCDFLARWPTLKHAQRARKARLTAFFHEHNVRYPHIIEQRIQGIASATALTTDAAVIEPNRLLVEALVQQLRVLLQSRASASIMRSTHSRRTLPDFDLFASFPGAGAVLRPAPCRAPSVSGATAMAALDQVQKYSGIAPVTERSGNKSLGALAPALPEVSAPDLRRVRRSIDCRTATGPRPTTSSSAAAGPRTKQPCAHSPSSGSASCSAAGRTARPTTKPPI